jgi:hypothetical protein
MMGGQEGESNNWRTAPKVAIYTTYAQIELLKSIFVLSANYQLSLPAAGRDRKARRAISHFFYSFAIRNHHLP